MEFETFEMKQANANKFRSESGSPTLDVYEYKISDKGIKELVKTDRKENVYDRIQADYDSTDINKLMIRFSLGDQSALDIRKGIYMDVTDMPSNYAELLQRYVEAENYFKTLPVDVKELFNNSVDQFFTEFGSKEFDSKIAEYNKKFENHQFEDSQNVSGDTIVKEIEHE